MDEQRFNWVIDGLDEDKLSEWEIEFVESVKERMEMDGDLTPRQEEKLEEIFRWKAK